MLKKAEPRTRVNDEDIPDPCFGVVTSLLSVDGVEIGCVIEWDNGQEHELYHLEDVWKKRNLLPIRRVPCTR